MADESFEISATLPQIIRLAKAMNDSRATMANINQNVWRLAAHGVQARLTFDTRTSTLRVDIHAMPMYETLETVRAGILKHMGPA
jgi:hypothetical protein